MKYTTAEYLTGMVGPGTIKSTIRMAVVLAGISVLAACSGSASKTQSTTPDGDDPPPATVSFSASSTVVNPGGSVTLTWSSSNASSCSASGGWSGSKALTDSEVVGPLNQDTSFTLSCSGAGGGAVRQLTVQVDNGNGPTVTLDAAPEYVAAGNTSTLTWSTINATSCTASGGWNGPQNLSGSFTTASINSDTSYQLDCDGPNGSAVAMVTVRIADKTLSWQAPTQNVDGTPLNDLAGYVIYWGSSSRNYNGPGHTINSPSTTQWEATMAPGSYYFAMTAFDSDNNESAYSNEVLKIIP